MKLSVLSQICPGQRVRIVENRCETGFKERLEDLGLVPGSSVQCIHKSPAGSPAAYNIQGAIIALRATDAEKIWVEASP